MIGEAKILYSRLTTSDMTRSWARRAESPIKDGMGKLENAVITRRDCSCLKSADIGSNRSGTGIFGVDASFAMRRRSREWNTWRLNTVGAGDRVTVTGCEALSRSRTSTL